MPRIIAFGKRIDINFTNTPIQAQRYCNTVYTKRQIVLHYTAGAGTGVDVRNWWQNAALPATGCGNEPATVMGHVCTPFVVDRDGTIHILYPETGESIHGHLGWRALRNQQSIGIENVNWGYLKTIDQVLVDNAWTFRVNNANVVVHLNQQEQQTARNFHGFGQGGQCSLFNWAEEQQLYRAALPRYQNPPGQTNQALLQTQAGVRAIAAQVQRYIHLTGVTYRRMTYFAAYTPELSRSIGLLVKYLCRKHHIPAVCFPDKRGLYLNFPNPVNAADFTDAEADAGLTSDEVQSMRSNASYRFMGILSHQNYYISKYDVGCAFHWNKFYRIITDEWWLPCEVNNSFKRTYILNPYAENDYGDIDAARLAKMEETRSYYSNALMENAYLMHEQGNGGFFPIGRNNIWHGGIHLYPLTNCAPNGLPARLSQAEFNTLRGQIADNALKTLLDNCYENTAAGRQLRNTLLDTDIRRLRNAILGTNYGLTYSGRVFAAAGGSIVAARLPVAFPAAQEAQLDTTAGFINLDNDPDFGSRRFILIRHKIFPEMRADRNIINYNNQDANADNSVTVYTLYMHLAPPASDNAVNNRNPEWLNRYIEANNANPGNVTAIGQGNIFFPGREVCVGDYIGDMGFFRRAECLHFEVFSPVEFSFGLWANAVNRIYDDNANIICEDLNINNTIRNLVTAFVGNLSAAVLNFAAIQPALQRLREVKCYNKSEWSARTCNDFGADFSAGFAADQIPIYNNKLRAFSWWETVYNHFNNDPDANNRLNQNGLVWHYHPLKMLEYIDGLLAIDQGHLSDAQEATNNIHVDDRYYITGFEAGNAAAGNTQTAAVARNANQSIVYYHTRLHGMFIFSQLEIVCKSCYNNRANASFNATRLYLGLLEVLQAARFVFDHPVEVLESYVCNAHLENNTCTEAEVNHASHETGNAIDFRPYNAEHRNEIHWKQFYRLLKAAMADYKTNIVDYVLLFPLSAKFENNTPLTAAESNSLATMRMHLEARGASIAQPLIMEETRQNDHTTESPAFIEVRVRLNQTIAAVPQLQNAQPSDANPQLRYFIDLNESELTAALRNTAQNSQGQHVTEVNRGQLTRFRFAEYQGERRIRFVLDVNTGTQCTLRQEGEWLIFDVRVESLILQEINEDDKRTAAADPYMGIKLKLNRSITLPALQELNAPHRFYIDLTDCECAAGLRAVPEVSGAHEITYNKGNLLKVRFTENTGERKVRVVLDTADAAACTMQSETPAPGFIIAFKIPHNLCTLENIREGNHLNETPPSAWAVLDLDREYGLDRLNVQDQQPNTAQHHFLVTLNNCELQANSPVRQWAAAGANQYQRTINIGNLQTILCTCNQENRSITLRLNAGAAATLERSTAGTGSDYRIILKVTGNSLATQENIDDLATIIMSEASVGNNTERRAVAWTVRNRLENGNLTRVSAVSGAYATNQTPPANSAYHTIARDILSADLSADITGGCTHFFSPIGMPKQGESTTGFDVGGGLHTVSGIAQQVYFPSWAATMTCITIAGVREAYYKFYR